MNTSKNNKKSSSSVISLPKFDQNSLVFKGTRFDVHQVLLSGSKGNRIKREVVVHPGAVLILPILDKDNIIMIKNQRFAVGKELWELPAGTLEQGEQPIETAQRELIEETGYQADTIEPLVNFFTSPGICNEVMYAFVAKNLTNIGQALEESEKITVEVVNWKRVMTMIKDGTIIDGKTITALLYYNSFVRK